MRWTSEDDPSVATVSAWVSPRVKRPEPCARGTRPTSTLMGRISVTPRPSIRMPSSRTSCRTVFLCTSPKRLLLTRASRRARDRLAQPRQAAGEVAREPDQQVGRRLGIRQRAMVLRELHTEVARERLEPVILQVRIAIAGDDERVEVAAGVEARAVPEGLLDEAEIEAHRVTDHEGVTDEGHALARRVGRGGRLGDVLVRDAVHLVA